MARDSRWGAPEGDNAAPLRWPFGAAAGAGGFAALTVAAGFLYAWPYAVDDAYIVARYATRLAEGHGYTFNAGPATDGITGPLWLFLAACAARAGWAPMAALKCAGALCSGLAVLAVVRSARRRVQGRLTAYVCAALCVTSAPLVVWGVAGLETGLACLLVTWLGLSAYGGDRTPVRAALALLCLPWLRPELVPFAAVAAAFAGRQLPRRWLALSFAFGLASVAVFRLAMFAHLLPMTSAAKPPELGHGVRYLLACLQPASALTLAAAASLSLRAARARYLSVALAVHGVSLVLAGGDWMPAARLCAPIVPCAALLASEGFVRVLARRRWLAALLGALAMSLRIGAYALDVSGARAAGLARTSGVQALVRALPAGDGAVVALDIGMLGTLVDARIVDLGGLTEPRIAYARGGHLDKRVDSAWLASVHARAIVLHSDQAPRVDALGQLRWFAGYPVERRVLALPWVRANYRVSAVTRYDARYFYIVLVPRSGASESVKR